jgi:hypothetical protein
VDFSAGRRLSRFSPDGDRKGLDVKFVTITRVLGLSCVAVLGILSLIPGADVPRTGAPHVVEHFIAYSMTALLLGLAYRDGKARLNIALALILFAGAMEVAQFWALDRGPYLRDWLGGCIGAGVGIAVAAFVDRHLLSKSLQEG